MSDALPTNAQEYQERFHRNQKTVGFGIAETTQVVPCPFCAAAEWARWRIIDLAMQDNGPMKQERTCVECGRSAKMLITQVAGGTSAELVQTGGDDPPEWLGFRPRRV